MMIMVEFEINKSMRMRIKIKDPEKSRNKILAWIWKGKHRLMIKIEMICRSSLKILNNKMMLQSLIITTII